LALDVCDLNRPEAGVVFHGVRFDHIALCVCVCVCVFSNFLVFEDRLHPTSNDPRNILFVAQNEDGHFNPVFNLTVPPQCLKKPRRRIMMSLYMLFFRDYNAYFDPLMNFNSSLDILELSGVTSDRQGFLFIDVLFLTNK